MQQYRTLPGPDVPVVLSREGAHGPVVHGADAVATGRGIARGKRIVDMQAIHPDLHVEPADLDGDRALLRRLVHWSRRWCPWTAADGADGLVLDATGSTHLWGGEPALLEDIARRFALQGLTARLAMAPMPGAARALARHGPDRAICTSADVDAHLAPLPVGALGIDAETDRLLSRLGLKTLGALADMPRQALMRRFAAAPSDRNPLILLDRAAGRMPDPLNAPPDHREYHARTRLPEPVIDPYPHLPGLAETLCRALVSDGQGARRMRLTIYRIDGECRDVTIGLARASRDPAHLLRLWQGRLDAIDPGFGFDLLTLDAVRVEPVPLRQEDLGGGRDAEEDLAGLVDRLSARLGPERVTWARWTETHRPERMTGEVPALGAEAADAPTLPRERPVRLLDPAEEVGVIYGVPDGPPTRFVWRRVTYRALRHAGPERIAPEWWRDRPGTRLRDYYKVEVEDGRRFWLYREGVLDDGRGDAPRWFLHGFFA
ncbi:DNA polymerase Y family protein [Palleronia sp. LCG004]|uniref:Y-family DNA polymerase n=1 Tax=Palleronia sp. LCG004 TaxID=3079304 RepID=UPI00294358CB|nr:DNA polymerase Y family protein [Palleronia sp. LCG004]WOI55824.1 DNA polymerase Y family protein [Palleronia sp. LCG004]